MVRGIFHLPAFVGRGDDERRCCLHRYEGNSRPEEHGAFEMPAGSQAKTLQSAFSFVYPSLRSVGFHGRWVVWLFVHPRFEESVSNSLWLGRVF